MSIETYEMLVGKFELYAMLEKGLDDVKHGRAKPAHEIFAKIESRLKNDKV